MYKTMRLNPLWTWDKDTTDWIEKKKKELRGKTATDAEEDEIDNNSDH